ncbi:hypothetical protein EIP86_010530 [Pleurotus ostreatoroseus]|nr:hypothetical protein EIP86_010530 [Pleurotus ostreatoroseus]
MVYTTTATALALAALSPAPNFVPLVALLATMRLTAFTFLPRPSGYIYAVVQAGFIAVAAAAMHLAPSMDALSTPNLSLIVISMITFAMSGFSSAVVFAAAYAVRSTHTMWAQLTLFPALWASAWGSMSSVSPVGQLVTWSPVVGLGPYSWLRSILGQWAIDWVTAAWAVVFSEVAGAWLVGTPEEVDDSAIDRQPLLVDYEGNNYQSVQAAQNGSQANGSTATRMSTRNRGLLSLTAILVLLAAPSYTYPHLPLPINSGDTTPLSVACIMPPRKAGKSLTFDDYFKESSRWVSMATTAVLVWPEGSVSFSSEVERDQSFDYIVKHLGGQEFLKSKYVGVGFEEVVPPVANGPASKRNGFALIDTGSGVVQLSYYKRNLVPIAESFSMVPGHNTPDVFTLQMPAPSKNWKPNDWASTPNHTRPIPITTSICLDFAHSSSFTSLDSRPAVILAPAKTWHVAVGNAMWEQAKARATETGSTVFWCDGGEGALGGIATSGYSEIVQRGWGSWSKVIPLAYPFDTRRTVFTLGGQSTAFAIVWLVTGVGYGPTLGRFAVQGSMQLARRLTRGSSAN